MAARSGLTSLAYIEANFRKATVEDFVVGLGWAEVRKESNGTDDQYYIVGHTVSSQLAREAINFQEMIARDAAWIATYYAGGPIGGPV